MYVHQQAIRSAGRKAQGLMKALEEGLVLCWGFWGSCKITPQLLAPKGNPEQSRAHIRPQVKLKQKALLPPPGNRCLLGVWLSRLGICSIRISF